MQQPQGLACAGCSKRLSSKAAASEEARRTLRYVELLSEARTLLADFFSILLDAFRGRTRESFRPFRAHTEFKSGF